MQALSAAKSESVLEASMSHCLVSFFLLFHHSFSLKLCNETGFQTVMALDIMHSDTMKLYSSHLGEIYFS